MGGLDDDGDDDLLTNSGHLYRNDGGRSLISVMRVVALQQLVRLEEEVWGEIITMMVA